MKFIIAIIILLIFYGCKLKENNTLAEKFDTDKIKNLVNQAIANDSTANNKLSNLIDYPDTNKYNSIIVDSLITDKDTLYFVILENENPVYNIFAAYNSDLTPIVKDKSLNGNISYEAIKSAGKDFIEINESYLSKDTLLLNRISLYSIDSSGAALSFRTHTKFSEPGNDFFQDLVEISDTFIKTNIRSSKKSKINGKTDNFIFDSSTGEYSSLQNLFDGFIKREIENFNYQIIKRQITDTIKTNL
jgi:hypothetical protein